MVLLACALLQKAMLTVQQMLGVLGLIPVNAMKQQMPIVNWNNQLTTAYISTVRWDDLMAVLEMQNIPSWD